VSPGPASSAAARRSDYLRGFGALLLLGILGLFIVKWQPYFFKALHAASSHSLGPSIVVGRGAAPPPPSVAAAVQYASSYFQSVWQALALGLLLAATVEALLPRDWVSRVLGTPTLRSSILGGLLALPGMM
jgi:uncharacterized membrane protein YraQ (UPF0718 family)